jgi:6-phosphogluconolactonase
VDAAPEHAAPHIHEATPTADGKWLLVNDLGSDRIWIYSIDKATAKLTPGKQAFWQGRDKSGPRHIRIHRNGRWVYNVNELDATMDHLEWDNAAGTLKTLGFVSTIPPEFPKGKTFPGEIVLSADCRFAYVGNRIGSDTIVRFDLDPKTGTPKFSQIVPFGGVTARDIALDPTGRFLLVACQKSGGVVVMGIDKKTGKISDPLHSYPIDSAECLVFTT